MRKTFILLLLFFAGKLATAQLAPEKAAWNNLGKERWVKVRQYLDKALRKDKANVAANFTYSWYFFTQGNPQFHLDSSYVYLQKVKKDFALLSKSEKQKLDWYPINEKEIERLQSYQDSAAFERAFIANTELAYGYFIKSFPWAKQVTRAKELQVEVGFLMALRRNTHEAFSEFLEKYPDSFRAAEAKNRYDKLLYEFETAEQSLQAYENFYSRYPDSPYRQKASERIFVLSTLAGDSISFSQYINKWKDKTDVNFAEKISRYLLKEEETEELSLPIWKKNKYSFLSSSGEVVQLENVATLENEILCNGLTQYFFLSGNIVYSKGGNVITHQAKHIQPKEAGFVVVEKELVNEVWHISGNKVFESDANVELLRGRFWLEKKSTESNIYSLLGQKLLSGSWRKVVAFDGWLALQTDTEWHLISFAEIVKHQPKDKKRIVADEVRQYKQGLWYKRANKEALLSSTGNFILPEQVGNIEIYGGGILLRRDSVASLLIHGKKIEQDLKNTKWINPFWVYKKANKFGLTILNESNNYSSFEAFDTIQIVGDKAIAYKNDSLYLFCKHEQKKWLTNQVKEKLIKNDSVFLITVHQNKLWVSDAQGSRLFSTTAEKVDYLGGDFFLHTKKDKQWIVNRRGLTLLELQSDFQFSLKENHLMLIQKNKFGLLGSEPGQLIKPRFEKAIIPLGNQNFLVFQSGKLAIINWTTKTLPSQMWDEYEIINHQYIWLKKAFFWNIYDLKKSKVILSQISDFKQVKQDANAGYYIFKQAGHLGLFHTNNGILLDSLFTDIQIKGKDVNFIVAQKEVEEAGLVLFFVYDKMGKQLLKEVYEEKDFEKALCD